MVKQTERISKINKPDILILREKDLSETEYELLAKEIISVCEKAGIECILHSFIDVARRLKHRKIHLPMPVLKKYPGISEEFDVLGASVHSVEEAVLAESLGASYVTASNVFETDCKPGMKEKGILWLDEVCGAVSIPVYALGGISEKNINLIKRTRASGACMMSGYMKM